MVLVAILLAPGEKLSGVLEMPRVVMLADPLSTGMVSRTLAAHGIVGHLKVNKGQAKGKGKSKGKGKGKGKGRAKAKAKAKAKAEAKGKGEG